MPTVIKAGTKTLGARRLAAVDLADHLAEARGVKDQARQQALEIIAKARAEAVQIAEQAKSDGFKAGYQHGLEQGRTSGAESAYADALQRHTEEHAQVQACLAQAAAEIQKMRADLMSAAERDLLDFALTVARKLTFAVGSHSREAAQENLRRALRWLEATTALTIRVHPHDVENITAFAPRLLDELSRTDALRVVADESLAPGGCRVQSSRAQVDASLETQIDELVQSLIGGR